MGKMVAWAQAVNMKGKQPPGNSLEHIRCAASMGFDMIELDLQITKDGVPVLLHDGTVDRETDGSGALADLTFADLGKFSKGSWEGKEIRIPSLAEALKLKSRPSVIIGDMRISQVHAERIAAILKESRVSQKSFMVTAYDPNSVKAYAKALPNSPIFLKKYVRVPDIPIAWLDQAADLGVKGVMFEVRDGAEPFLNIVEAAHKRDLKTMTFVHISSFSRKNMDVQIASGVDFILTTTLY